MAKSHLPEYARTTLHAREKHEPPGYEKVGQLGANDTTLGVACDKPGTRGTGASHTAPFVYKDE